MQCKYKKLSMKARFSCIALMVVLCILPASVQAFEIEIDVAPNVLNLQSQGTVVTVHTTIDFKAVDVATVYMNGIAIDSWKDDNQGNFVAKFLMRDIKNLPLAIGNYNTLKMVGLTTDNEPFWGSQEILVINVIPMK